MSQDRKPPVPRPDYGPAASLPPGHPTQGAGAHTRDDVGTPERVPPEQWNPELRAHLDSPETRSMDPKERASLSLWRLGRVSGIARIEDGRWHLSVSHPFRLPTWAEINAVRDSAIPADVWLCQPMPPKRYWMNLHPYCLHLWEIADPWLVMQWAVEGNAQGSEVRQIVRQTWDQLVGDMEKAQIIKRERR